MFTITTEMVLVIITAVVTNVIGVIAKKNKWTKTEYIPFQNILIGTISTVFVVILGLEPNIAKALLICLGGAFGAAGIYDTVKATMKLNTKGGK